MASNISNASTFRCNPLLVDVDNGVAEVVGINIAIWVVVLTVFVVMQYTFRSYSRVGLIFNKRKICITRKKSKSERDETDEEEEVLPTVYDEQHWYSWIINYFTLKDDTILQRCGPDAVVFLSLERYIIILLLILSFFSLVVILPVNVSGKLDNHGFSRTTIGNLDATKDVLWVHTIFTLLYLVITGAFMIRFSFKLGKNQQDMSTHTVMMQWIPPNVHKEDILQHFQETMPGSRIVDFQFAYDVSTLTKLSKKLDAVEEKLESVESVKEERGKVQRIRPGWKKLCCWNDDYLVNAQAHYEAKRLKLTEQITDESAAVRSKRLGIGFLSFARERDAKHLVNSYKVLHHRRPNSSLSRDIKAWRWWVSQAPFHLDILWKNLSVSYFEWWVRWITLNLVLFLFLFFFTTPSVLLTSTDQIRAIIVNFTHTQEVDQDYNNLSPLVRVYISSLMLLLFSTILTALVSKSCLLEAHWMSSEREQTVMRKTFLFLVLMLIFLPSIGFTSLNAVAELAAETDRNINERLSCVFLPSSGAFFVVAVLSAALIGTSVELLRVRELTTYLYYRITARTRKQKEHALRKASDHEFQYGVHYATFLAMFTMVMTFSITTPVIVPVGALYFILRYLADRYNIFYVYKPAPFHGRQYLHQTAINLVIVGAVILQLSTLFFSVLREGRLDPRTILMIVTFTLTLAACVAFMMFGWFSHLLPRLRVKFGKDYRLFSLLRDSGADEEEEEETVAKGDYIPPVMQRFSQEPTVPGYQSFSSTERSEVPSDDPLKQKEDTPLPSSASPPADKLEQEGTSSTILEEDTAT